MTTVERRVAVVILTHNRKREVSYTLDALTALAERPSICLVDNASTDGTAETVRARFPHVRVLRTPKNLGAAGRNWGVRAVDTPYVAFCDDDTWWAEGSLTHALATLERFPRLAAVTARVLVGNDEVEDPASTRMAMSPLENELGIPGAIVLGVMAGACMVRRDAFLAAGGYQPRFFIGAEERLLAMDLMSAGWFMAYLPAAVVHHHPSSQRDAAARRRLILRNELWCTWLRRPRTSAVRETRRLLREALAQRSLARALPGALLGLPWVLRERHVIPPHVEAAVRRVSEFYAQDMTERTIAAP